MFQEDYNYCSYCYYYCCCYHSNMFNSLLGGGLMNFPRYKKNGKLLQGICTPDRFSRLMLLMDLSTSVVSLIAADFSPT